MMCTGEEVSSVKEEERSKDSPHLRIVITRQPPVEVFSEEWFDVCFDLSSSFPAEIPPECIELCANVHSNTEGQCDSEPVKQSNDIDIDLATQTNPLDTSNGQSVIRCKIKSPSMKAGQPVFYNIIFFQRIRQSGAILKQVEAAVSSKVHIVAFKLSLDCDWGVPVIFYKDEGGKDKHLKTIARLYGSDGEIVIGTHVPLKLSLIYDNEEGSNVLKESETLRVLDSSKHYIDPDNGKSIIKFRIEDVSKNHQGLSFKLRVTPGGRRSVNVGNAVTPAISVRSKRNKRTLSSSSPARRKTLEQIAHSPGSLFQSESFDGGSSGVASCPTTPNRDANKILKGPNQDIDLRVAINYLSEWAKEVSYILPTLNWTPIGYCQNADGTADFTKPNHLMPYPNDCIKRLLKSQSNAHQYIDAIKNEINRGSLRNGKVGGEADVHPLLDPNRPHMLPTPKADSKHSSRDYVIPSSFLPTPITPMSPIAGAVTGAPPPLFNTNHTNGEVERKMINHTHEMLWNKNKKANNDVKDHNENLKRIEYILAKHFHSPSGEKIGFPVCDINKDLLGFFRESDVGEGRFFPLSSINNFDPRQATDVRRILEEAINQRSDSVHRLKDCGTIASLFDHAIVYDWSREFSQHG